MLRIKVETAAGHEYIGFAKEKFWYLERRRLQLEIAAKREKYIDGAFTIEVFSSNWDDYIKITGGDFGDILLSNGSAAADYNWTTDTIQAIPAPASNFPDAISPIYNGRCQTEEYNQFSVSTNWSVSSIGTTLYNFLSGINRYEMSIFADVGAIFGRIRNTFGQLANMSEVFIGQYAGNFGSLFSLPTRNTSESPWNLFNGIFIRALNPSTKKVLPAWYWTPSLFTVQHNDAILFRGWYYGDYPNRSYINDTIGAGGDLFPQPLVSLKVSFRALLDTRYNSETGDYNYGWAELVTEVDGEKKRDVFVYLQKTPLVIPSNSTAAFVFDDFSDPWAETIWVGSDLEGFPVSLRVDLDLELSIDDIEVVMWNFAIWTNGGAQDTGVCIMVRAGNTVTFYRYLGSSTVIHTTDAYHSHSHSRDGTMLAVFDGEDGIITAVTVLDMFGTRDSKAEGGYHGSSFTVIRQDGNLKDAAATSGCIIPFRDVGFNSENDLDVLPYDLATSSPDLTPEQDYTEYLPSMSTMQFKKLGDGPPIFHNVICKNGIDAEFGISIDDCFSSVIIQEDPNNPIATEKLIGSWKYLGASQGVVRGDYSGNIPDVRFNGIGTPLYISTIAEMTMAFSALTQRYEVLGNIGPITYEGFDDDFEPIVNCDGTSNLVATTACNQRAEVDLEDQLVELELSGTDTPVVGTDYDASGGIPPYVFSFDGGTINPETGEILTIDACGAAGTPRWATVTVTDDCGTTAELEVRLSGGVWNQVLFERQGSDCLGSTSQTNSPALYFGKNRSRVLYGFVIISGSNCNSCSWVPSFPFYEDVYCKDPWKSFPCVPPVTPRVLCETTGTPLKRYVIVGAELQEWQC